VSSARWPTPLRRSRCSLRLERGLGSVLAVRIGDRDRELATAALRRHFVAGRLSVAELSDRIEVTLRARSRADLDMAMQELPLVWEDLFRPCRFVAAREFRSCPRARDCACRGRAAEHRARCLPGRVRTDESRFLGTLATSSRAPLEPARRYRRCLHSVSLRTHSRPRGLYRPPRGYRGRGRRSPRRSHLFRRLAHDPFALTRSPSSMRLGSEVAR
jgi:hypothetical protein